MEVAIDPEELEGLDDAAVRALYEQRLSEERARHSREVCFHSCSLALAWIEISLGGFFFCKMYSQGF